MLLKRPVTLISIHALREEGDHRQFDFARRSAYFYPRPPRGGRPRSFPLDSQFFYFYPRPPRGGRLIIFLRRPAEKRFLSTPSARRATGFDVVCRGWSVISIHALREEGDTLRRCGSSLASRFLSTPSARRATHGHFSQSLLQCLFLSTPSARRATSNNAAMSYNSAISIHALREEGDSKNRDKISIFKQIIQHSARI